MPFQYNAVKGDIDIGTPVVGGISEFVYTPGRNQ
jgi:hypothetical protein